MAQLMWRVKMGVIVSGCLLGGIGWAFGQSETAADQAKAVCRQHLHLIYQAIQHYRQEYKQLPDNLSSLVPRFLNDPTVLNCPTAVAQGTTSAEVAHLPKSNIVDSKTTYLYEFGTNLIHDTIAGWVRRTMRDFKQHQMRIVGSDVPMVRCLVHEPPKSPAAQESVLALNLTFGGDIYQSGLYWESKFAHVVNVFDLSPARLFADLNLSRVIEIRPRSPKVRPELIDLSAFYNASLTKGWVDQHEGDNLAELRAGVRKLNGVQYDIRGLIQLGCLDSWLSVYPRAVTNIPVGLTCQQLHFLHSTVHHEGLGTPIAHYVVHYANGKSSQIPIRYGEQVVHWNVEPTERFKLKQTRLAWHGVNPVSKGNGTFRYLYDTTWTNPQPSLRLRSLDLISHMTRSGPFVVAITAEP